MTEGILPYFRLREVRRAKGMSQTELCRKLGVCRRTLYNLENGLHAPSGRVIRAIRDVLGDEVFTKGKGGKA